jgi:membrane protein DedA with SNARE-associated domain
LVLVDDFLRQILDQPAWLIYLVVGVIVFVEDAIFVGFVVPGETVAILGGVSAFLGRTDLTAMVLLVVIAAIVGDSVGYEVGKIWGTRVLAHHLLDKRRHQLDRAQTFLRERGGSAVFLGRWTAFFRAVMPALAGVSRMPYRTFLIWNAAGGIVWGVVVVTAGYLAGLSYERAAKWLGGGATAIVATIVVVALVVWHVRRRRRERALERELGTAEGI